MDSSELESFEVKCKKCGSKLVHMYSYSGGCPSCNYGASIEFSCNNPKCDNTESVGC